MRRERRREKEIPKKVRKEQKRNRMGRRMGKHGEKICTKHLSDRGLISKLHKELSKLNTDKQLDF